MRIGCPRMPSTMPRACGLSNPKSASRYVVDRRRPMRATVRCGARETRIRRRVPDGSMSEPRGRDHTYVMGRSADETRRLQDRAKFFEPLTRHLFEDAGLRPGLGVLDIGRGPVT